MAMISDFYHSDNEKPVHHLDHLTDVRATLYSPDAAAAHPASAKPAAMDWSRPLAQGLEQVRQITGTDAKADAPHIQQADVYLQAALAGAQQQGPAATKRLLDNLYSGMAVDERLSAMRADKGLQQAFAGIKTKYGIDLSKPDLSKDEIQTAMLRLHLDAVPAALTAAKPTEAQIQQMAAGNEVADYLDLMSMRNQHKAVVNDQMAASMAPSAVAMVYADFLLNCAGGVSRLGDPEQGPIVTAGQIIEKANAGPGDMIPADISAKMLARAQALEQQGRTTAGLDQHTDPLAMLEKLQQTPGDAAGFRAAYDTAHKPDFLPYVDKQIAAVQSQAVSAQFTQQQKNALLAAWTAEKQAPALTDMFLGRAKLLQDKPDNAGALQLFQQAVKEDPDGVARAKLVGADKHSIFDSMVTAAQAGVEADKWLQEHVPQSAAEALKNPAVVKALTAAGTDMTAIGQLLKKPGADNLAEALARANDAVTQGDIVSKQLKPFAGTIDREYQTLAELSKGDPAHNLSAAQQMEFRQLSGLHQLVHLGSAARLQKASVEIASLYPDRAQQTLNDLRDQDRDLVNNDSQFKAQFDDQMNAARTLSESREGFWANVGDKFDDAFDWAANNKGWIMFAVAAGTAIALTGGVALVAAGVIGGGTAIGAALAGASTLTVAATGIATGTAGGTVLGASTGAALDMRAGRVGSFGEGFSANFGTAFEESSGASTLVVAAPLDLLEGSAAGAGIAAPAAQAVVRGQALTRLAPYLGKLPFFGSRVEGAATAIAQSPTWNAFLGTRLNIAAAVAPRVTRALSSAPLLGRFAPAIGRITGGSAATGFIYGVSELPDARHPRKYLNEVGTAAVIGGLNPWFSGAGAKVALSGSVGSKAWQLASRAPGFLFRTGRFLAADYGMHYALGAKNPGVNTVIDAQYAGYPVPSWLSSYWAIETNEGQ